MLSPDNVKSMFMVPGTGKPAGGSSLGETISPILRIPQLSVVLCLRLRPLWFSPSRVNVSIVVQALVREPRG